MTWETGGLRTINQLGFFLIWYDINVIDTNYIQDFLQKYQLNARKFYVYVIV